MAHHLILVTALAAASSAAAQMSVAPPADVVAAVDACRQATGAGGVDVAKLKGAGWESATANAKGKPIALPVSILGKADVKAIIMVPPSSDGSGLCIVTARLPNMAAVETSAKALDVALATPRKVRAEEPGAGYWFPQGHLVQLQATGKPNAPGVRVGVMAMAQEKK